MTFLNPLALLALAAVALPLVLHLFNLRRPREVDFSSLAFVKELQKSAVQRVRIKEWLLLALRMLAIACLVLAFARPTLEGAFSGIGASSRTAHALVIDNSLSMTLRSGPGVYLEQAKRQAEGILRTVNAEDEILVASTAPMDDRRATPVSRTSEAQSIVDAIAPRAGARSLPQTIAAAAQRLQESTSAPRRVVYVMSDLQETALTDSLARALPDALRDVAVTLLSVETRPQANVAIENVRIRSRIAEVGQPVQMEATLVNHGTEALPDYVASVVLDGERVAQATTSLPPGQPTTVSFTATPQARGWLAGTVEGEDDAFPDDNVRHFTLHVPDERRLLLVQGSGQPTQYVDLALSSSMVEDRIAFQTETIREEDLAARDLGRYDAVLLVGLRTLSSGEVNAVQRYVEQGGGVLFFPSEQARPDDYNALFKAMGGGSFRGFTGSLGQRRRIAAFDRVDLEHPLFEGVFDQGSGSRRTQIERPDVFYAMNYQTASAQGQTLIELSNGFPFLHELRHGTGAMLLVATAPSPQWSDLPVRGLFIPLLYRSMYYLSSSSAATTNTLVAGRPGEVRITGLPPTAEALRVVAPDGVERTPDQRTVFGATLLSMGDDLQTLGLYDVRSGERLVQRVAVNLDPRESALQAADLEDAAKTLSEGLGTSVQPLGLSDVTAASVAESVRTQQTGTEIWNVFLLLALLFLVSEMLVASQWKPETAPA